MMNKALPYLLAVVMFAGFAYAEPGFDPSQHASEHLQSLVELLYSVAAPLAMGLFVFSGIVYSVGQAFDKATREKAKNWSMSIITGVSVGVLIMVFAPFAVGFILGMGAP